MNAIGTSLSTKLRINKNPSLDIISYSLAAIIPTLIVGWTSLRMLPLSSGFVTFPLQDSNLVPYRDYFDPVTPLTFFEAHITANANYGLFNYVLLVMLTIVPIFGVATYALGRLFLGRAASILLSLLMEAWIVSLRLEQVGGWNTQYLMLMAIGFVLFAYSIVQPPEGSHAKFDKYSIRVPFAILSGLIFSLACLDKQTCLISLIVMAILMTIWIAWEKPEVLTTRILRATRYLAIGFLPPIFLTFIYLVVNHAFKAFVKDMLSGGGKNPSLIHFPSILYQSVKFVIPASYLVAIVVVAFALYALKRKPIEIPKQWRLHLTPNVVLYLLFLGSSYLLWRYSYSYDVPQQGQFLIQDALICSLPLALRAIFREWSNTVMAIVVIVCVVFLPLCYEWADAPSFFGLVANAGTSTRYEIAFVILFMAFSTLLILSKNGNQFLARKFDEINRGSGVTFRDLRFVLLLSNAFSLSVLVNLYSSGVGFYIEWFIPSALIYLAIALKVLGHYFSNLRLQSILYAALTATLISALAVTFHNPYDWNQWGEFSVFSPHTSSQVPRNFGFELSRPASRFYARVERSALLAAKISGAGSAATVFSYPAIPTAAESTGLKNYTGIKCVVLWFDVCPNSQAETDLKHFERHLPNVIIWEPISKETMSFNETTFVKGKSALENWEAFRKSEVASGKWKLVDHFVANVSNSWTTDIYAVVTR